MSKRKQKRCEHVKKTGDGTILCPLCHGQKVDFYFEDKMRIYLNCRHCQLVFVPPAYWLAPEEEKAVYDLHVNDVRDPGYRRFLSRLTVPLQKKLAPNLKGLDFGCGPGPALAAMMEEAGHKMDLFDPFYNNTPAVFSNPYDFILATEVVEHLKDPAREFDTLFGILRPGGWLGIMTKQVIDLNAFSHWHYIRDMTHICFYSKGTFKYLAQHFNARLNFVGNDVILLQKK